MQLRSAIHHLAYPVNGASLMPIALTSILISIGWSTFVFGAPLVVIMLTWYLKFGLAMVEHIAWQVEGKPVLAIEMLNPVEQKKSLVLLILVGVFVFGIFAVRRVLGNTGCALFALLAVTLLPAAVTVQTVRDSARIAFNIREWFAVIPANAADPLSLLLMRQDLRATPRSRRRRSEYTRGGGRPHRGQGTSTTLCISTSFEYRFS